MKFLPFFFSFSVCGGEGGRKGGREREIICSYPTTLIPFSLPLNTLFLPISYSLYLHVLLLVCVWPNALMRVALWTWVGAIYLSRGNCTTEKCNSPLKLVFLKGFCLPCDPQDDAVVLILLKPRKHLAHSVILTGECVFNAIIFISTPPSVPSSVVTEQTAQLVSWNQLPLQTAALRGLIFLFWLLKWIFISAIMKKEQPLLTTKRNVWCQSIIIFKINGTQHCPVRITTLETLVCKIRRHPVNTGTIQSTSSPWY